MPAIERQTVIAAMVSIGVFAPLFWMVLDRDPPYLIKGGTVEPRDPLPGAAIHVSWDVMPIRACASQPTHGSVTREIIDSKGVKHAYASVDAIYSSGAPEINRVVQLPQSIPSGPAVYHSQACYACNPVQQIWPVCFRTPDLHFNVGSWTDG